MPATTSTSDEILKKEFHANAKVEVSRFKGLGEMMAAQLKETTMDPRKRTLLRVMLAADDRKDTEKSVERLMGTKAEARFDFIQERAEFAERGGCWTCEGYCKCCSLNVRFAPKAAGLLRHRETTR